jgi:hypothetical protein
MADISGVKVDSILKVDKANISPKFKFGGDKKTINVENLTLNQMITNQYAGTISEQNPDLIAEQVHELSNNKESPPSSTNPNIELVISPFIGIVKSPNLPGTRVHLEFTVINNNEIPITIKGINARVGEENLHFKLFFSINDKGMRSPDLSQRFPIFVGRQNGMRIAVELENFERQLINQGELPCELFILIGNSDVVSQKFVFDVNEAMINTLNLLDAEARTNNSPLVFDAMIKS